MQTGERSIKRQNKLSILRKAMKISATRGHTHPLIMLKEQAMWKIRTPQTESHTHKLKVTFYHADKSNSELSCYFLIVGIQIIIIVKLVSDKKKCPNH